MRISYFCIIFLLLQGTILSRQYNFKTYSVEDGLAQSQVFAVCQDGKGYMWFGTNGGGVSKYDGMNFTNLTTKDGLSDNIVNSIIEDHQGNLWFGTDVGISKYDGETFTNFTIKNGLNDNTIWATLEDSKGNLWFGTDGGISKYDGETFTNFTTKDGLSNSTIYCITGDSKSNIWFGTNGGGVYKYDEKSFKNFTTKDGLMDNTIFSILKDSKGNLWFGTYGGISKYDGETFTNFTTKDGLMDNSIMCILEDSKGNLWFGTDNGGVSKYNGKTFITYTTKEGLSNNSVCSIAEDREGNLWFGTDGGGICKYGGEAFINFNTEDGLNNNIIYSIFEDREGNMWFGACNGGINKYDGKTFANFTTRDELINNAIMSILEDRKGNMWFATDGGGVSEYNGKSFINYTIKDGLNNNSIRYVFEDREGNLWLATHVGVSKYDGKRFTNFTTGEGLTNDRVSFVLENREGNMWFATDGGGVSEYDGKTFINYTAKDGLSSDFVMCVLEDSKGNLWFGTYGGGISKYNYPQKGGTGSFESFTTDDGLCNDAVLSMVFDNAENLWIGTNKGIDKFDIPQYYETGRKVFKHYGKEEGFIGIECNQKAVCKDSKGNIWFGTIKGAIKYNPKEDAPNKVEPLTYITNLRLFFEDVNWSTYTDRITLGLPIGLKLPHDENHATFDFVGISLTIPGKVRCQYKLEGFDKEWSPAVKEDHVTYPNLPPGKYTFEVKACNNDGVWNKEPTAYSFVIIPPFWQTLWFRLTLLMLAGMIIYGIFLMRTTQIRHRAEVLEKLVDERTAELRETQKTLVDVAHRAGMAEIATGILHNVGNVLNSVKVSSQILKERIEKSKVNGLKKALSLMEEHADELDNYITSDEKGKLLPTYLIKVGRVLEGEQDAYLKELSNLNSGISHIEEVVTVQQDYAGVSGVVESVSLSKMMDDVVRMYRDSFNKHKIKVVKDYNETAPISVEKGKLMQVFVNLLKNAQESLLVKGGENGVITIDISEDKGCQTVEIIDNGVGIKREDRDRIFSYGFTTKEGSKGLGLHTSALTMAELGGKILAHSDGEGMGAKFTVIVPKNK